MDRIARLERVSKSLKSEILMHKIILALLPLLMVSTTASGQSSWQPTRGVAFHIGADISTIDEPRLPRVGGAFFLPAAGPFELYGVVELIPEEPDGLWQGMIAVRVRPFRRRDWRANWYVGGGWVLRRSETRKAVLSGVELKGERTRPFAEVRFHGPIEHADGQLELVFGVEILMPRS